MPRPLAKTFLAAHVLATVQRLSAFGAAGFGCLAYLTYVIQFYLPFQRHLLPL